MFSFSLLHRCVKKCVNGNDTVACSTWKWHKLFGVLRYTLVSAHLTGLTASSRCGGWCHRCSIYLTGTLSKWIVTFLHIIMKFKTRWLSFSCFLIIKNIKNLVKFTAAAQCSCEVCKWVVNQAMHLHPVWFSWYKPARRTEGVCVCGWGCVCRPCCLYLWRTLC